MVYYRLGGRLRIEELDNHGNRLYIKRLKNKYKLEGKPLNLGKEF